MKIKKVLISQPAPAEGEKSPYNLLAQKYNFEIVYQKLFKVEGVSSKEFRRQQIRLLDYDAIVLTSRQAVDHLFRLAKEIRVEIPETMKYFCSTENIALYLQRYIQYRKRKILHGHQSLSDLADLMKKHKDDKFLIPCSDSSKNEVPSFMDELEINYKKAVIYKTVPRDLHSLDIKSFDLIVLFSPMGIKSLFKNWPNYKQQKQLIGTFGDNTTKAALENGLRVDIQAPSATCPSMTMAIEYYILNGNKKTKSKNRSTAKKKEIVETCENSNNDEIAPSAENFDDEICNSENIDEGNADDINVNPEPPLKKNHESPAMN